MTRRLSLILALVSIATPAFGAGMTLTERGVRPLGRGGAFVAGADDLHALSYNPAGLSEAGSQLLIDAAYIQTTATFLRQTYFPASSSGMPLTRTEPASVTGYAPFLPVPTIAGSHDFGLKTWNFGASLHSPYTAQLEWPERVVDPRNNIESAAPQRYSAISSQGTILAILGLMVSKTFLDGKLALGIGPQFLMGTYASTLAVTNCPGVICPEQDPSYDAINHVQTGFIFAPSAAAGIRYTFNDMWRIGLSGQLPFWVDAPARVEVRLPSAAIFNGASVENGHGEARLVFRTPAVLRLGVEMRPVQGLRIELTGIFEGWAIHDRIDLLRAGRGTNLLGVTGFPSPYPVGDLSIRRNFRDTFSVRLGAEYGGGTRALGYKVRAGVAYERSAIPTEYLNAMTPDLDKITASAGASLLIGKLSLDLVYAHSFGFDTHVDPARARAYPATPVREDAVGQTAMNGGDYTLQANIIGLGMSYRFD